MAYKPTLYKPGWYEIPGYSEYAASKSGYVMNKKTGNSTKGSSAGHYLKVFVKKDGASKASLQYTHILICTAFQGKPAKGQVVLHLNDVKDDVRAKNLKWGTQKKNIEDVYKAGLKFSHKWS